MVNPQIITLYLFRLYCGYFSGISLLLGGILLISNLFDTLQKFKTITLSGQFLWKLSIYKVPYLINELSPLISFMAALLLLSRLVKYNELVTMLSSGMQFWRVLFAPVVASLCLGMVIVALVSPIGAYGLLQYERLEAKLTKKKQSGVLIAKNGISFFEEYNNYNRIVYTKSIHVATKELKDVIILFVDQENRFIKRIEAPKLVLENNTFKLINAAVLQDQDENTQVYQRLDIPTNFSINSLAGSVVLPELVSVWNLPSTIAEFAKSGLPILNYQLYYYKQLFKPLMMVATVMMACCFTRLGQRDNFYKTMLALALVFGFATYSGVEIILKILAYQGLDPMLAVLLPIMLIILVSNFIVLHIHEA